MIGSQSERPRLALERAAEARAAMADCHLCAHHCGVNRLEGELGLCRAGAETRAFSAQIESGDELELIPTFAIAFSGCDLRCAFCITGESSWNPRAGQALPIGALAQQATLALSRGARSVMLLGGEPTIHLPSALELVAALPAGARIIWKTNGHASAQARQWLEGMFDVWLVDYKFGNDGCAQTLARTPDYTLLLRENLLWAASHAELIVRHLLMPGHVDCCWRPVAKWLSDALPEVKVSLRTGFWPAWHTAQHVELRAPIAASERQRALEVAREFHLRLVP